MDYEWDSLIKKISSIAQQETGNQINEKNYSMVESRLSKRLSILGIATPKEYLKYLESNFETEKKSLVSLLTTHHTYFFREYFHFEDIEKHLLKSILENKKDKVIRIWSSASSQGQEAYSLSMFFYKLKKENLLSGCEYKILGTDIDHKSIQNAQNSVYFYKELSQIPMTFIHGNWVRGLGSIRDFVKPKKHIKDPITFEEANLLKLGNKYTSEKFDIIFCRNVLIYFNQDQVHEIINSLLSRLEPYGILVLGISESILGMNLPVKLLSNSIYRHKDYLENEKIIIEEVKKVEKKFIRVLCVDDSPTILVLLKKILTKDKGFEVVATAANAKEAREQMKKNSVDIMTLDIHMPEETGIDYLKSDFVKGQHPPVLIVSSIERDGTSIAKTALDLGASDYVEKPDLKNIEESSEEICFKLETIFDENKNDKTIKTNKIKSEVLINDNPIRLLIVDDSPTIRLQLKNILSKNSNILVVGEVEDPRQLENQIKLLRPDVITLDINMPHLSGIDVLKLIIPQYKIPTIVVSALNMEEGSLVLEALELGAVDFFHKPNFANLESEGKNLIDKIFQVKSAKILSRKFKSIQNTDSGFQIDDNYLIAIGSSTGGTEALKHILQQLPSQIPPIVVVQHIPEIFSKALADRLNSICPFEVIEAKNGDIIEKNKVYIAPGNMQMKLIQNKYSLQIKIEQSPTVNGHRPSVDVLFGSIAELNLNKTIGIILTGMGNDGAKGLKKLKESGAKTIAQNEETCVVFGMPKEAIKLNAVDYVEPIENIANKIYNLAKTNNSI
ncbi:chemotaxis-specific protein-glutamate methyltransferase CheB [Silvanigrella aquatica]|uniref:chemotaxis-specific protein-glutamate methyltransferase CheB n=1 Tax=Silvanigrella aquatica TaxID=1915309 RepID=UPI000ADDBFCB|nr:chemotaxis-specific protein-glutamate methyltransferase CheB [Silvanigrella aquatica]